MHHALCGHITRLILVLSVFSLLPLPISALLIHPPTFPLSISTAKKNLWSIFIPRIKGWRHSATRTNQVGIKISSFFIGVLPT